VPFAEPRGALQAMREAQVVAEHRDAEAERLLRVAQRNLVDEALDEEAGVAVRIAPQPARRQRDSHRDVVDRDVGDRIGWHQAFAGYRVGLALDRVDRRPGRVVVEQPAPELECRGWHGEPGAERVDTALRPEPRAEYRGDRRARTQRQLLLPARPGQLHRASDLP